MNMIKLAKAFAVASLPVLAACTPSTVPQDNGDRYRRLTPNEISMAQTIFGNQIDYASVRLYRQAPQGTRSRVTFGNIYMSQTRYSNDYGLESNMLKQSVFMHEMAHVWQEQSGQDLIGRAIDSLFKHGGDYDLSYDYTWYDVPRFSSRSIEQQASILQDYFELATRARRDNDDVRCDDILRYEATLKHFFPAIETPRVCR